MSARELVGVLGYIHSVSTKIIRGTRINPLTLFLPCDTLRALIIIVL